MVDSSLGLAVQIGSYPDNQWRSLPEVGIAINGVPIDTTGMVEEDVQAHPGWKRRYKAQPGFPIVYQEWIYNGEILRMELLSANVTTTLQHQVTFDCHECYLSAQSGLAWSAGSRLAALFADPGATTAYDSQCWTVPAGGVPKPYLLGGMKGMDAPVTSETGSSRMCISVWPPYIWTQDTGCSPTMITYMDEWCRIQVHRPYQWPDPVTGKSLALLTAVTLTTDLPIDSFGFKNSFAQNAFDHNHLTIRQLASVYLRKKWPFVLDQIFRLFWGAMHDKKYGYWKMKAAQLYGNSERLPGWLLAAAADMVRVLTLAGPSYNNRLTEVLAFASWHITNLYGPTGIYSQGGSGTPPAKNLYVPPPAINVPDPVNLDTSSGVYPLDIGAGASGHTFIPYRSVFMNGIFESGAARLLVAYWALGLPLAPEPMKLWTMAFDSVYWNDAFGWNQDDTIYYDVSPLNTTQVQDAASGFNWGSTPNWAGDGPNRLALLNPDAVVDVMGLGDAIAAWALTHAQFNSGDTYLGTLRLASVYWPNHDIW